MLALEWKLTAAFAASLLVLLVGGAGLWAFDAERRALVAIRTTREVIDATRELRVALLDSETGQRGYVLTEEPAYLAPYEDSLARLDPAFERFQAAARRALVGPETVQVLRRRVAAHGEDGQHVVALVAAGRRADALALIDTDAGRRRMDAIRRTLNAVEGRELAELDRRRARLDDTRTLAALVVGSGTASAFVLLVLVYGGMRGDIRRESLRQAELERTNAALAEQRAALAQKNDELEVQLREVAKLTGQLGMKNEELEARNQDLDRFAYVASHDLRAPLRGIGNLATWIEEDLAGDGLPAETAEHLALLRNRVSRMEGLIDGILQYSRAGRRKGPPERLALGAVAREVVDLLGVADDGTVTIRPELDGLEVVADKVQLAQVLQNLVGNALKHGRGEHGAVEVGAARDGRFVEVYVRDQGPGIDPRYHERIFGIFQTLAPRDEVESTGIGLALVKRIVEANQGKVRLDSQPGRGATFRFTWPAASERAHA